MKSMIVRHSVKPTDGDVAYRVAALQELMSTSGTVEVTAQQAERLAIESCFRRLGRAMVGRVQVTECRLVRSAEAARRIALDSVAINVVEAGGFKGYCGQRRMQTEAGSACLTLLSSPADYWLRDTTWTALVVSRNTFESEVGPVARYDGHVFTPGSIHAVILDAHIRAMLALPDPLPSAEATMAGRSCLAMLAVLLGTGRRVAKAAPVEKSEISKTVRSYIADHISDSDLGPEAICRAFNMSRSRLYRVVGSTEAIASEIRRLRLSGAHREIASPESFNISLSHIAQRWGFRQDRSFRRAFRLAFGYSPTSLRAKAASNRRPMLPANGMIIEDWLKAL